MLLQSSAGDEVSTVVNSSVSIVVDSVVDVSSSDSVVVDSSVSHPSWSGPVASVILSSQHPNRDEAHFGGQPSKSLPIRNY